MSFCNKYLCIRAGEAFQTSLLTHILKKCFKTTKFKWSKYSEDSLPRYTVMLHISIHHVALALMMPSPSNITFHSLCQTMLHIPFHVGWILYLYLYFPLFKLRGRRSQNPSPRFCQPCNTPSYAKTFTYHCQIHPPGE